MERQEKYTDSISEESEAVEMAIRAAFTQPVIPPPDLLSDLILMQRQLQPIQRKIRFGLVSFIVGILGISIISLFTVIDMAHRGNFISSSNDWIQFPWSAFQHSEWILAISFAWAVVGLFFTYAIPLIRFDKSY